MQNATPAKGTSAQARTRSTIYLWSRLCLVLKLWMCATTTVSLAAVFGWLAVSNLTSIGSGWSLHVSGFQLALVAACAGILGSILFRLSREYFSWVMFLAALPLILAGLWVGTAIASGGLQHLQPAIAWTAITISLASFATASSALIAPSCGLLSSRPGIRAAAYLTGLIGTYLGPVVIGG